ncbi:MAG TPA: family 10 glycosylhydrolase [Pyrinomonadaceae bacterium]|jgi:uncharacterized lipoprotein YddW (UPF0748 family)
MRRASILLILFCLLCQAARALGAQRCGETVPRARREFRAAWVATVNNIDWPSKKGLTSAQQQEELIGILDLAKSLNLNAVILQVRPQCDAIYPSKLEPWSEFLSGEMGKAPEPIYDPLAFAVREAHARGLELHAWLNPYRALFAGATRPASPEHISVRRPDLARTYGKTSWLDPGEREVQDYSLGVVLDVVRRYDVDGVHFDDYFYPYPEKDSSGKNIPFPDDASWQRYVAAGGRLSRDDWRRRNVDDLIERVAKSVKRVRPGIKFSVSPFGIWRPGSPPRVKGFDAYTQIYADSRRWLREGWVDFLAPQLYWPIAQEAQSYTALLDWWNTQNPLRRYVWPGNAVYRIGTTQQFTAAEILDQIRATRERSEPPGNLFFSMKSFLKDQGGINGLLKSGPYREQALVPPMPWLKAPRPASPEVTIEAREGGATISWKRSGGAEPFLWVVYVKDGSEWEAHVLPASARSFSARASEAARLMAPPVAVSAVSRAGLESVPACARALK